MQKVFDCLYAASKNGNNFYKLLEIIGSEENIRLAYREVIGISEAQLRYVTNTQSGMGLIKHGNAVIPFDNTIRKDCDLYRLYNTNLHEMVG